MKEITLKDVISFIEHEELGEMDIRAITRAVRHQDDVLGDIVVFRQDVRDIACVRLNELSDSLEDGDFENMADEVVSKVGEHACVDGAEEDFWDSLESMVDEEAIGILARKEV